MLHQYDPESAHLANDVADKEEVDIESADSDSENEIEAIDAEVDDSSLASPSSPRSRKLVVNLEDVFDDDSKYSL